MTVLIVGLLIAVGFIFIVVEIFFIPGFSVPGLVGIAMIGYGIFKANVEYGMSGALIALTASLLAAAAVIIVALKSRTVRKIGLEYNEKEAKAVDDYRELVGREGVALSTLRPSGTAVIDGRRWDVVTEGDYIERDTPIRVIDIEGTRIVVSPAGEGDAVV